MKCPNCGRENADIRIFCSRCGEPLPENDASDIFDAPITKAPRPRPDEPEDVPDEPEVAPRRPRRYDKRADAIDIEEADAPYRPRKFDKRAGTIDIEEADEPRRTRRYDKRADAINIEEDDEPRRPRKKDNREAAIDIEEADEPRKRRKLVKVEDINEDNIFDIEDDETDARAPHRRSDADDDDEGAYRAPHRRSDADDDDEGAYRAPRGRSDADDDADGAYRAPRVRPDANDDAEGAYRAPRVRSSIDDDDRRFRRPSVCDGDENVRQINGEGAPNRHARRPSEDLRGLRRPESPRSGGIFRDDDERPRGSAGRYSRPRPKHPPRLDRTDGIPNSRRRADYIPRKAPPEDAFFAVEDADPFDELYELDGDRVDLVKESVRFEEPESKSFFVRHVRGIVAIILTFVTLTVFLMWANTNEAQLMLAQFDIAWSASAYAELGKSNFDKAEYASAAYYYGAAYERDAEIAYAEQMWNCYIQLGLDEEAISAMRKCIALNSSNAEYYLQIKNLYSGRTDMPDDIKQLIAQGYQLTGDQRLVQ